MINIIPTFSGDILVCQRVGNTERYLKLLCDCEKATSLLWASTLGNPLGHYKPCSPPGMEHRQVLEAFSVPGMTTEG